MNISNIKSKLENGEDITVDFVGDSITNGTNFCRREETFVAKFADLFAREFPCFTVNRYDGITGEPLDPMKDWDGPVLVSLGNKGQADIIKNGVGGNTVARALGRKGDFIGEMPNGKRPDITFLMFGINDALKSDPNKYVTPDEFKSDYKTLLNEIRNGNPDTFIIMMSATTSNESIDAHCEKSAELAAEQSIPYIDLHALWNAHYKEGADNFGHGDWLKSDPWHPTPKGAEMIARYVFSEFMNIIK